MEQQGEQAAGFLAFLTGESVFRIVVGVVSVVIFWVVYRVLCHLVKARLSKKMEAASATLLQKSMSYVFWVLLALYVMSLFGVNLKALWGAAGVAGLALGFAAQTSASNFISGLFVLGERAMKIGDFVSIGETMGTVESVGLLSAKIRTADNQRVRVPNSAIIDGTLTNFSSFPTRRLLAEIPVAYDNDLDKALAAAHKVPPLCPSVLSEPAPLVFYDGFSDAVVLRLAVWFDSANLFQVKNEVYTAIARVFKEDNIKIAFKKVDVKVSQERLKFF